MVKYIGRKSSPRNPAIGSRTAWGLCLCGVFLAVVPETACAAEAEADRTTMAGPSVPTAVRRYARRLVERYDLDGDGQLNKDEWGRMHGEPASIDANGDRTITTEELARWIAAFGARRKLRVAFPAIESPMSAESSNGPGEEPPKPAEGDDAKNPGDEAPDPHRDQATAPKESSGRRRETRFYVPAKRLPAGLPEWFLDRDLDGDGQLDLSEFAPKATAADEQEYARYDLNGDGLVTPQEYLRAVKAAKAAKPQSKP